MLSREINLQGSQKFDIVSRHFEAGISGHATKRNVIPSNLNGWEAESAAGSVIRFQAVLICFIL